MSGRIAHSETLSRWTSAVGLVAVLLTTVGTPDARRDAEDPARARVTSMTPGPPTVTQLVVARSVPVTLRVPAIGLTAALSSVGLNGDGTIHVPTDFARPGWYRLGASPGERGSAVIVGHVDSYRGPAVFFRLRSLRAGDAVQVDLADGAVARFAVTRVVVYAKDKFPARLVYGDHGSSTLQLVTCGGTFDARTRSYRSNVVAYSTLVAATRP